MTLPLELLFLNAEVNMPRIKHTMTSEARRELLEQIDATRATLEYQQAARKDRNSLVAELRIAHRQLAALNQAAAYYLHLTSKPTQMNGVQMSMVLNESASTTEGHQRMLRLSNLRDQ